MSNKDRHISISNLFSPKQNLTFNELISAYKSTGISLPDDYPSKLQFFTPDGKYNMNAYLLSDENHCSVVLVNYNGNDRSSIIENKEIGNCSLVKATKSILHYLDQANLSFIKKLPHTTITKRQIEPIAIKEAAVNTIVHNDYTTDIPIKFEIFENRMEFTSSGGLCPSISKDEFFTGYSAPRNLALMNVFRDLNLVDFLGSGIPRILSKYDQSIFKFTDHYLRVIFLKKT